VISEPGQHIDKLYVHDDGVGPFLAIPITANATKSKTPNGIEPPVVFSSDWSLDPPKGPRTTAYFLPEWVIVPAYPKIRAPYFSIHEWVSRLARMFATLRAPFAQAGLDVDKIRWDIKLTLVNPFKAYIREHLWANLAARELSKEPLPRFIWTATMLIDGVASRLLIFDGTDTTRACPLIHTLWLDDRFRSVLDALFADPGFETVWHIPLTPQFYYALKNGRADFL
jgi:hypothetical protein